MATDFLIYFFMAFKSSIVISLSSFSVIGASKAERRLAWHCMDHILLIKMKPL